MRKNYITYLFSLSISVNNVFSTTLTFSNSQSFPCLVEISSLLLNKARKMLNDHILNKVFYQNLFLHSLNSITLFKQFQDIQNIISLTIISCSNVYSPKSKALVFCCFFYLKKINKSTLISTSKLIISLLIGTCTSVLTLGLFNIQRSCKTIIIIMKFYISHFMHL